MTTKQEFLTQSKIADRALKLYDRLGNVPDDKLTVCMDLEAAHEAIPLDLDKFLAFDASNFAHDMVGIRTNINRVTGTMDDCFLPRCAR